MSTMPNYTEPAQYEWKIGDEARVEFRRHDEYPDGVVVLSADPYDRLPPYRFMWVETDGDKGYVEVRCDDLLPLCAACLEDAYDGARHHGEWWCRTCLERWVRS